MNRTNRQTRTGTRWRPGLFDSYADSIILLGYDSIIYRGRSHVRKGMDQGKRPDLTGGGLIRSAGGWTAVKALRSAGARMKGDERILGSGEFVENALKLANEAFERRTHLGMQGITLVMLIKKVADYHKVDPVDLSTNSKVAQVSKARAVLCFLCVREFGYSGAEVARRLHASPSTVSKAAARGRGKVEDEMLEKIME